MTTIELDRPMPRAPQERSRWDRVDLAVRLVLLTGICLGWLSMVPLQLAASRPATQFLTDLGAHKVTSIAYDPKARSLRWHNGGIRWYAADLKRGRPAVGASPDALGNVTSHSEGDTPENDADRVWVIKALDADGLLRKLDLTDWSGKDSWASPVPWRGLPLTTGLAVMLSFFLMLGRDQRRFGTRWAWFWVFCLVGWGVGPALFLLLEPAALWLRRPRRMPASPAFAGGAALLVALGLKALLAGSTVGFFGLW